jgi:hypothetical protein
MPQSSIGAFEMTPSFTLSEHSGSDDEETHCTCSPTDIFFCVLASTALVRISCNFPSAGVLFTCSHSSDAAGCGAEHSH